MDSSASIPEASRTEPREGETEGVAAEPSTPGRGRGAGIGGRQRRRSRLPLPDRAGAGSVRLRAFPLPHFCLSCGQRPLQRLVALLHLMLIFILNGALPPPGRRRWWTRPTAGRPAAPTPSESGNSSGPERICSPLPSAPSASGLTEGADEASTSPASGCAPACPSPHFKFHSRGGDGHIESCSSGQHRRPGGCQPPDGGGGRRRSSGPRQIERCLRRRCERRGRGFRHLPIRRLLGGAG